MGTRERVRQGAELDRLALGPVRLGTGPNERMGEAVEGRPVCSSRAAESEAAGVTRAAVATIAGKAEVRFAPGVGNMTVTPNNNRQPASPRPRRSRRRTSWPVRPTWAEAWEEFREEKHLEDCSLGTIAQYRYVVEPFGRYMADTLKHQRPEDVSDSDVRAFLKGVKEHGVSGRRPVGARRFNHVIAHLHRFFAWLLEKGYIDHDPTANIAPAREDDPLLPELTPEHIAQLLAQIDTTRFAGLRERTLLLLLYDSGLRVSEALLLKVDDGLRQGVVTVIGKGNKERRLGLTPQLLRDLRPYLRERERLLVGIDRVDSPWLFVNQQTGDRLGKRTVQESLRRYGEQAGIDGVRVSPHTIRHSYALNFVRQRGDPFRLQHVLGHSDLTMTRRYCRLADRDVVDEMRRFSPLASMELVPPPGRRTRSRTAGGEAAAPDRG